MVPYSVMKSNSRFEMLEELCYELPVARGSNFHEWVVAFGFKADNSSRRFDIGLQV